MEELYERIDDLRSQLYWKENVEEVIKDMLLHSSLSIGECDILLRIMNLKDTQKYEFKERKNQEELLRIISIPNKYKEI